MTLIQETAHPEAEQAGPFQRGDHRLLAIDAKAPATVILQRIAPLGFDGGITIPRTTCTPFEALQKQRGPSSALIPSREQCQVDWGHFRIHCLRGDNRQL